MRIGRLWEFQTVDQPICRENSFHRHLCEEPNEFGWNHFWHFAIHNRPLGMFDVASCQPLEGITGRLPRHQFFQVNAKCINRVIDRFLFRHPIKGTANQLRRSIEPLKCRVFAQPHEHASNTIAVDGREVFHAIINCPLGQEEGCQHALCSADSPGNNRERLFSAGSSSQNSILLCSSNTARRCDSAVDLPQPGGPTISISPS